MKLIKLNEQHYIIVDDSEITEGVNQYYFDKHVRRIYNSNGSQYGEKQLIITHSTEPIDGNGEGACFITIKPLSLSEVEELVNGYSVEQMADNVINQEGSIYKEAIIGKSKWVEGFKTHQELVKDKLFTIDDMIKFAIDCYNDNYGTDMSFDERAKINIQSLLPPTEWNVKFVDGKIKLI